MTCLNCGTELNSKFCPECGQKADVHPISVGGVVHDFFHALTHTDKGLLLTLRELFRKPGIVAKEYIAGKRKKYFNPISFLVIITALSIYINYKIGYFESMGRRQQEPVAEKMKAMGPPDGTFQLTHSAIVRERSRLNLTHGKAIGLVLIVPLIALLTRLFFWRPRYNYAQHFVLIAYLFGLSNVIRMAIFFPLHLALPGKTYMVDMAFQLVFLTYMVIGFRQFFQNRLFVTIIKSMVILVLFVVGFWASLYSFAAVNLLLFH